MPFIQTVLGPIRPGDLGRTYSHDHLLFRPPAPFDEADPDLRDDGRSAIRMALRSAVLAGSLA